MRNVKHYLTYLGLRLLLCMIQALSPAQCTRIAAWLGWLAWDVLRIRRTIVLDNLCHAFPNLGEADRHLLARRMWNNWFLLVFEIALSRRKIHRSNWFKYVRMTGAKLLMEARRSGRPVIMVSAHQGNFEVAGYVLGLLGFTAYAVARKLDNPYLDRFVNRLRSADGHSIIPKRGGYEQIIQVLEAGGTVGFLADQHAGPKGYQIEFFGRPASVHKAIALFAFTYDALLAVGCTSRVGGFLQYEMCTTAVADPRSGRPEVQSPYRLTQWYTAQLEKLIRENPDQYWWLHDRWKYSRAAKPKNRAA